MGLVIPPGMVTCVNSIMLNGVSQPDGHKERTLCLVGGLTKERSQKTMALIAVISHLATMLPQYL